MQTGPVVFECIAFRPVNQARRAVRHDEVLALCLRVSVAGTSPAGNARMLKRARLSVTTTHGFRVSVFPWRVRDGVLSFTGATEDGGPERPPQGRRRQGHGRGDLHR